MPMNGEVDTVLATDTADTHRSPEWRGIDSGHVTLRIGTLRVDFRAYAWQSGSSSFQRIPGSPVGELLLGLCPQVGQYRALGAGGVRNDNRLYTQAPSPDPPGQSWAPACGRPGLHSEMVSATDRYTIGWVAGQVLVGHRGRAEQCLVYIHS